ncbi:hypothetical protein B1A87_008415 [Arthrobacter sp. KBS0703]|jgi:hypothetical protein|uniref:hypothetical protein n=1 Tax=Bacteria TaxID=2 RepID=UPI00098ED025|nr:hypothetical protein [Arthrobacter sp. KBS0703]TSE15924.1 hypothetical protein B1A87_008415 [Arthrobacter sp. KBS0703]
MSNLRKLGAIGTLGLLVSSSLIFGSANAAVSATCRTGTAAPSSPLSGRLLTATNFEGNSLSPFVTTTSGNGTAAVASPKAHSGTCSARLHATADVGSVANMGMALPARTKRAGADAWINIATAGLRGNNVPYVRFFSGATRVADVFRDNATGQLWLRVTNPDGTFTFTRLSTKGIPLNTWHRVQMQVRANGAKSTIEVWFDGASVFSKAVSIGATSLSRVQFGAEHPRQMGDSYIDDVVVRR